MKRRISLKDIVASHHYKTQEMNIKTFHFNPIQVNTYVLHDETKQAVIIDPGNYIEQENNQLMEYVDHEQLSVQYVVNTHPHIDHVCGNRWCVDHFHCPVYIHEKAVKIYHQAPMYGSVMGIDIGTCPEPSRLLQEGDMLTFGHQQMKVLYTPGHADGSICLYDAENRLLFVGDVLFAGSVGRTDFPTGSATMLLQNIKEKLMVLPGETTVFCGHGINTTIEYEKHHNLFIQY
jgi:glyoxylase-like metal-dependent hydrolase (beta-lactamase superfamily II)